MSRAVRCGRLQTTSCRPWLSILCGLWVVVAPQGLRADTATPDDAAPEIVDAPPPPDWVNIYLGGTLTEMRVKMSEIDEAAESSPVTPEFGISLPYVIGPPILLDFAPALYIGMESGELKGTDEILDGRHTGFVLGVELTDAKMFAKEAFEFTIYMGAAVSHFDLALKNATIYPTNGPPTRTIFRARGFAPAFFAGVRAQYYGFFLGVRALRTFPVDGADPEADQAQAAGQIVDRVRLSDDRVTLFLQRLSFGYMLSLGDAYRWVVGE